MAPKLQLIIIVRLLLEQFKHQNSEKSAKVNNAYV